MIAASSIRLATAADARDIAALSRDAIEAGLDWSWTPRRVAACLHDAATNVIVVRPPDAPLLGFAIMRYDDALAHLLLLAVQPGWRRRGLGSALLGWLERTCAVAGVTAIHLETRVSSLAARRFYRRHGFVETTRLAGYYQGVEDAVRLVRQRGATP